jgi:hypothetical protein
VEEKTIYKINKIKNKIDTIIPPTRPSKAFGGRGFGR